MSVSPWEPSNSEKQPAMNTYPMHVRRPPLRWAGRSPAALLALDCYQPTVIPFTTQQRSGLRCAAPTWPAA